MALYRPVVDDEQKIWNKIISDVFENVNTSGEAKLRTGLPSGTYGWYLPVHTNERVPEIQKTLDFNGCDTVKFAKKRNVDGSSSKKFDKNCYRITSVNGRNTSIKMFRIINNSKTVLVEPMNGKS